MTRFFELFDAAPVLQSIPAPDAEISFMQAFYSPAVCATFHQILYAETPWRQEKIRLWGKDYWQPRLTAWYGDPGKSYFYSGIRLEPQPWTETLYRIKHDVEMQTGHHFNSVLLNLYRDEKDSVSWHSDDEPELGPEPVIASLSFGSARRFRLRHKRTRRMLEFDLADGSLLLMKGRTQQCWAHAVEKEGLPTSSRINLTFRQILAA